MEKEKLGGRARDGMVRNRRRSGDRRLGRSGLVERLEGRVLMTTVAFWEGRAYPTASPQEMVVADFNGDGRQDLGVAVFSEKRISVLLNAGNGTFRAGMSFRTSGSELNGITHGDFNRDGREDVAVAAGSQVGVFFNVGNGRFRPEIRYTVSSAGSNGISSIAAGDFDGDGKLDLAATNLNDVSVGLFLNRGNGTFSRVDHAAATSQPMETIKAADMNGDGRMDLVGLSKTLVAPAHDNLEVWVNDGSGGFQKNVLALVGDADSLALGDVNGDRRPDVAVTTPSNFDVSVFMNSGSGTLAAAGHSFLPIVRGVTLADVNGDRKLDLVATGNMDTLRVWVNGGHGTFGAFRDFHVTPAGPGTVAAGDFNGDGAVDLAMGYQDTPRGGVVVLRHRNSSGVATTVGLTSSKGATRPGEAVTFTARVWPDGGGLVTGRVRFVVNGVTWGSAPLWNGVAVFRTTTLPSQKGDEKPLTVVAVYDGDWRFAGGFSAHVEQRVTR